MTMEDEIEHDNLPVETPEEMRANVRLFPVPLAELGRRATAMIRSNGKFLLKPGDVARFSRCTSPTYLSRWPYFTGIDQDHIRDTYGSPRSKIIVPADSTVVVLNVEYDYFGNMWYFVVHENRYGYTHDLVSPEVFQEQLKTWPL